ncbi:MAG: hypothetical protein K6T30_03000 [Alicyclobacillus sp.]|nr:hypothetical protein [Alicyclobacillus sp.]
MKWVTLEALRILHQRLQAQGKHVTVVLLTPAGWIQGELADFADSYEESVASDDPVSATVHLRTDIWRMYEAADANIVPVDAGAVVHLRGASLRMGGRRVRLDHLAVFARDIIGYSLSARPLM